MSGKLRITFTGGGKLGDTVELDVVDTVLVGRSHAAAIRLKEPDVSGRHLEIVRLENGCVARNLSRYGSKVDGRRIGENEEVLLRRGSVIEIGSRDRFRIDVLPPPLPSGTSAAESVSGLPDGATAAGTVAGAETMATVFATPASVVGVTQNGADSVSAPGTVATRGPTGIESLAHVSYASVEESATRDAFSVVGANADAPVSAESDCVLGDACDDAATADDPLPPFDGQVAADVGEAPADGGHVAVGGGAEPEESPEPDGETILDADVTNSSAGFVVTGSQKTVGEAKEEEEEDGETQELQTRVGSIEEIIERKHQLERRAAAKHRRFFVFVILFFAALAGVWFATANRRHVEDASGPFRADGEPDIAEMDILNETGDPLLFIQYPRDDRMEVVKSSDSNQIEVASYLGRDRDIPFKLFFARNEDPAEINLSSLESFEKWMKRETEEGGFSFAALGTLQPEVEFFEDAFPGWQELETQSGVPFVRSEYTRTIGTVLWRGFAHRLRSGSTVYTFRTEVPEVYWRRAWPRLKGVPFVGIYRVFIDGQWDSPGKDGFLPARAEDDLVVSIRHELTADGQRTWLTLEKMIDTLLAMTWGKTTPNAKTARKYLDAFLARKESFYNERALAYESARLNGDEKGMRRIFEDCRDMFSILKHDRYYYLVNNPEVWRCQRDR